MARAAIISKLRDELDDNGSWAGETHIQKSTFFLQEAALVPLGYDFILYKHGPFSFDLRDDLSSFRADGFIELRAQAPYGPRLMNTELGRSIQGQFPKTLSKFGPNIRRVASFINSRGVGELERLGTALLILKEHPDWDSDQVASRMCQLKPHVPEIQALTAVFEVKEFLKETLTASSI